MLALRVLEIYIPKHVLFYVLHSSCLTFGNEIMLMIRQYLLRLLIRNVSGPASLQSYPSKEI